MYAQDAELRQLRHQNRYLKQQNERVMEKLCKVEDGNFVNNFALQKMQTMVSGGLGLQMQVVQMQAQAGLLVPKGVTATTQRELSFSSDIKDTKLTAAATQRRRVSQRWQHNRQAAALNALKAQEERVLAARPVVLSADASGEAAEQPGQPASMPVLSATQSASAVQPAATQPATSGRPAHLPAALVPGYDIELWQEWGGKYQALNSELMLTSCAFLFSVPSAEACNTWQHQIDAADCCGASWALLWCCSPSNARHAEAALLRLLLSQFGTFIACLHADYDQMDELYDDWDVGIRQAYSDDMVIKRVASLRFLEYGMTQRGINNVNWRSGGKIRKAVAQRKVLIYAILRGLPDPQGTSQCWPAAHHAHKQVQFLCYHTCIFCLFFLIVRQGNSALQLVKPAQRCIRHCMLLAELTTHVLLYVRDIVCCVAANLPSTHPEVQESIDKLETFRREHSTQKCMLSNMKLHDLLVKTYGPAGTFEKDTLGWAPCPAMQQGNPKHRVCND